MIKIPKQLQREDFRFVLLGKWNAWKNPKTNEVREFLPEEYKKLVSEKDWKPLGKAPFEPKWQENSYKFNDSKLLSHEGNYGVIGGYGGLVILDIDDKTLGKELGEGINTFTVLTGSGGRHFYFIAEDMIKEDVFKDTNRLIAGEKRESPNKVLIDDKGELRALNYQVVCVPSRHPSGNLYEVIKDVPIKKVKYNFIINLIKPYLREDKQPSSTEEKYGFLGKKVLNKDVFKDVEKIVKENGLIVYDGSYKTHKIYHATTHKPGLYSSLKFSGKNFNEATILKLSVFSDKIVYILDNNEHVTVAEGKNVKEVLNKYRNEFSKLINTKLFFGEEAFIEKEKGKDTSRSGLEFRRVLALLNEGKKKEEIYQIMPAYSKWKDSDDKYRDLTYKKAESVFQKTDKKKDSPKYKKWVIHPKPGKLISEFAEEVADILKDEDILFYRPDSKDIVEIGKIKLHKNNKEVYTGFITIKPNRFITLLENYAIPGIEIWNETSKQVEFKKKSIHSELANTLIASKILQQALPQINRIFTVPFPIIFDGELTFPKKGYDVRFGSWLPHDSPEIVDTKMSVETAKELLHGLFSEFCFQSRQDYVNAVAALLTPFLRGLFSRFNARTPVFFYLGNRERAGKDYCAGITGIVYEGHSLEESPISTSENKKSNYTEELRKKILSAFILGRKRLHFSNNKGFINNAVFEAIATSERYSDRVLGKNDILTFDNELDFSLSGNVGVGFTPDFANRCRFIRLFLDIEDANSRKFYNPNLHDWVKENRGLVLSALYSLVRNWIEKGSPEGSLPFTSFSEWARVCGGIMECAGFDNPCKPDQETIGISGDTETADMKELFEYCYSLRPDQWITKKDIKNLINSDDFGGFGYLNFETKEGQTKFGIRLTKFIGRVLSGIRLVVKNPEVRSSRQELKFTKDKVETDKKLIFGSPKHKGSPIIGNLGNYRQPFTLSKFADENHHIIERGRMPGLTRLPNKEKEFLNSLSDEEIEGAGYSKEELMRLTKGSE